MKIFEVKTRQFNMTGDVYLKYIIQANNSKQAIDKTKSYMESINILIDDREYIVEEINFKTPLFLGLSN